MTISVVNKTKISEKTLSLSTHNRNMTTIEIEKKKYVLLPQQEYFELQKKAALKTRAEKPMTVEAARAYSKKLIHKWAMA
jgi:hypothetical protein